MTPLQQLKETRLLYSRSAKPMDDIIVQAMENWANYKNRQILELVAAMVWKADPERNQDLANNIIKLIMKAENNG